MSGNADNAPAAAEDAAPTATEVAAEIQQQIENLSEDVAKTVLPKDLINPVNAELLGSPSDAPDVVSYTGQTDDYVRWKRDIVNSISTAGLGWATQFFRDELKLELEAVVGAPVFIHPAYPVLTRHQGARLNMAREARIVRAQEQVYGIVLASIVDRVAESICDGGTDIARDPDKLVAAITAHARGTDAQTTGNAAMRQFYALKWNGTAAKLADQVDASFADMYRLQRITAALSQVGHTLSKEQLMVKVVTMMPTALDAHVRTYQNCTDLTRLQSEMKTDAERLDGSAAAGLTSFVTQTDQLRELEERVDRKIKALAAAQKAALRTSGGGSRQHPRAVMADSTKPPDSSGRWKWCSHHKSWSSTHDSDQCYIAHPELAPPRN